MKDMTYSLLKKGLDISSLRQKTVSTNISNLNTEGYKAKTVPFERVFHNNLNELRMNKTHNNHYGIDNIDNLEVRQEERKNTYVNDNRNNVDIDLEMAESAANELYYSTVIRQVNSKLSSLNYVINR